MSPILSKAGETFTPANRSVTLQQSDVTGQDFVANVKISGTVTKGGNGLAGVTVTAGGKTATTATDGTYTITDVSPDQTVTVTPSKEGEIFTPQNVTLQENDVSGVDFAAE